jgi:hypothetical protein
MRRRDCCFKEVVSPIFGNGSAEPKKDLEKDAAAKQPAEFHYNGNPGYYDGGRHGGRNGWIRAPG